MTDATADSIKTPVKPRKPALILGFLLALAGAGGGYFAVQTGAIPIGPATHPEGVDHAASSPDTSDPATRDFLAAAEPQPTDSVFLSIDPILISLNGGRDNKHLRFRAELEVDQSYSDDVARVMPRIIDVLNSYLRALDIQDLRSPSALTRMRAQMLRRISIVVGPNRVRDLLIMEFVLN